MPELNAVKLEWILAGSTFPLARKRGISRWARLSLPSLPFPSLAATLPAAILMAVVALNDCFPPAQERNLHEILIWRLYNSIESLKPLSASQKEIYVH